MITDRIIGLHSVLLHVPLHIMRGIVNGGSRGRIQEISVFVLDLKWYQFDECFHQCRKDRGGIELCDFKESHSKVFFFY